MIAAVYLMTEHIADVVSVLPYVLLLLCPLLHLVVHGGHDGPGYGRARLRCRRGIGVRGMMKAARPAVVPVVATHGPLGSHAAWAG